MNFRKALNRLLASCQGRVYIAEKSTKPKRAKIQLRKSKLYPILLMRLESKLTIWLVSRRLRKLLLKQSNEYYLNKPCQGSQRGY